MFGDESGGSQQELTGREKRNRRNRREEQNGIPANEGVHQKSKSRVRSSRDRLSFDPPPYDRNDPNVVSRKKKQVRRRSDFVENNDEPPARSATKKQRTTPHRLPRSVSEEVLALEGRFNPTPPTKEMAAHDEENVKSRRSKVQRSKDNDSSLADLPPSGRKSNTRNENRKKRKPRSTVFQSADEENYQGDCDDEISEYFPVDKEDIIHNTELSQSASRINNVIAPQALPSQPNDILFIEKKDGQGFVRENRNRRDRSSINRHDYAFQFYEDQKKQVTTLDFMLTTHLWFRSIAMICHGLLAGLALGQCIFVYSLTSISDRVFLENYYQLALPFQSMYYFLLAISTISILDRYSNMSSGWGSFFLRLLTRPSRALALVAYLLALVFSTSLTQLDDKISLYKDIPSLWATTDEIDTWKIINLMRVIGSFLGWIMVAMAPDDDQTAETIKKASEKEDNALNQFEMHSVQTSTIPNSN